MAETDFLALIEQGAEFWNRWRADHPTVQPDLGKAYLFGQGLAGFDLSGANLERACLISADLRGANLRKACLRSVYASKASLCKADLSAADLSLGNFGEADFSDATLSNVRAVGSNFAQACFTGAVLTHWHIDPTTTLQAVRGSHLLVKQQRRPHRGKFRPGELAALLQQLSALSADAVSTSRLSPGQRRWGGIGASGLAAIALVALAVARADRLTPSAGQPPRSAESSLPCEEVPLTTLLTGSVAHQYKNGAVYYGKFAAGEPADGIGTMVYPSGNRYDGEYQNGYRSGCGTFTFSNGRRYIGQFEADQFNGQGTWILENGERYIGEFKDNRCHGKGTFIFLNGSSKSGVWESGNLTDGDLSCDQAGLKLPVSSSQ